MINKIKTFIESNNFTHSNIIVAISGGPDSICLLVQLHKLKKSCNLKLAAAYVNHGIRSHDENLYDYELIKKLCKKLDTPLFTKECSEGVLEKIAAEKGIGIEAVAREVRYNFFNSLITKEKTLIALGHNRDDQVETQIMRFFQGSSTEGLIGIKPINDHYIRPMISINKRDIIEFLNKEGIKYNIDKTNLENNYLRNNIRNRLVPLISEIFPGYDNSLKKLEDEFGIINDILISSYDPTLWNQNGDIWSISYSYFISQNLFVKKKIIYDIFDKTYQGNIKDYRLPDRFLKPLSKSRFKDNEIILAGHGFILKREKESLHWFKFNETEQSSYFEVFNSKTISRDKINITISEKTDLENVICGLTFPFVIRSFNEKDKKFMKKNNLSYDYSKTFIIEKSYNNIYAIISNNILIHSKYKKVEGLSITIELYEKDNTTDNITRISK